MNNTITFNHILSNHSSLFASTLSCIKRSEEYKKQMLDKLVLVSGYFEAQQSAKVEALYRLYPKFNENSQCTGYWANATAASQLISLCPSRKVVFVRRDGGRYPAERHAHKCTCENCLLFPGTETLDKSMYGCRPLLKLEPMLRRDPDHCDSNGHELWTGAFEYVSVGCACMSLVAAQPY